MNSWGGGEKYTSEEKQPKMKWGFLSGLSEKI